jgi:hypothetical protein
MTPGIQKKRHSTIFMMRSLPGPFLRKTAIGGKNMANIIKTTLFMVTLYVG